MKLTLVYVTRTVKNNSKFISLLLVCVMVLFGLSACKNEGSADIDLKQTVAEYSNVSLAAMDFSYSDRDLEQDYNKDAATHITLDDKNSVITGKGAKISTETYAKQERTTLRLTEDRVYVISGKLSNGQILLNLGRESKAEIVFAGIDITSYDAPAFYISQADKVFVTLATNTENTLRDEGEIDASGNLIQRRNDALNGVVYSMADITFKGKGRLHIESPSRSGIVSKDDIVVTGGSYTITSEKDGIHAKDRVMVRDGELTIDAKEDGMIATNVENENLGYIAIENGDICIRAEHDAIHACSVVRIAGGQLSLITGGGNLSKIYDGHSKVEWKGIEESASAKGLKAGRLIYLSESSNPLFIQLDTADDAMSSQNDIEINGGEIEIISGDDGIHADSSAYINGGRITVKKSFVGVEGSMLTVTGGNLIVDSIDDALNTSGGVDASTLNGRPGQNEFHPHMGIYMKIKGGYLKLKADGDCIDSNGDIFIEGGTIIAQATQVKENGIAVANGQLNIEGGTLIGTCSADNKYELSSESENGMLSFDLSSSATFKKLRGKGKTRKSVLAVVDKSSKIVASMKVDEPISMLMASAEELVKGETYSLYLITNAMNVNEDGFVEGRILSGDKMQKLMEGVAE